MAVIYKISSLSQKVYIGSTTNFKSRFSQHKTLLKNGSHHSKSLQAEVNLHGVKSLAFEVIETVNDDKASERENYWFEYYSNTVGVHNTDTPGGGYKLTLAIDGDIENLHNMAQDLGYTHDRGPSKGKGNISKMVMDIAKGILTLKKK